MKISLHFISLIALLSFSTPAGAQGWEWVKGGNGGDENEGWTVTADALGNVFGAGYSEGLTEQFGSILLTGFGKQAVIIVKYDTSGKLLWATSTKKSNAGPINISTDAVGNLYLFGYYSDPTLSIGSFTLTNGSSNPQFFVAKYTPSGSVAWAINAGDAGGSYLFKMGGCSTDAAGNTYITAPFSGAALSIGPYTINNTVTAGGSDDIMLAKIDGAGNVVWARDAGGTKGDDPIGVAVTKTGKLYIAGMFTSPSLTFGSSTLSLGGTGTTIFLAKYDTSGTPIWGKSAGGNSEIATSIAVDPSDNPFIAGAFHTNTLTFGSYTLTCAPGNYSVFLAKFDSAGKVAWAKEGIGDSNPYCYSVATDFCGNAWISGSMQDTMDFNGSIIRSKLPIIGDPMFVVGYDPYGAVIEYTALPTGGDDINAICTDPAGNVYIGFDFLVTPFIVGKDTLLLPYHGEDICVAKYVHSIAIDTTDTSTSVTICSDTSTLTAPAGYQSYLWDDSSTLPTRKITTPGKYFVYCRNCGILLVDTINVTVTLPDTTYNRKDTIVCASESSIIIAGPAGYASYLWSTAATTASIPATAPGNYFVIAVSGCKMVVDTIELTAAAAPTIALANDTLFCVGKPVTFSSVQPAGNTLLWSTGSSDASITVSKAGNYWLRVTNTYGCSTTDTVRVIQAPYSALTHLGHVTAEASIKYGGSIQLNADNEVFYLWKPDDGTLNNPNINDPVATPVNSTTYTVYGYDQKGCIDSAAVHITVDSTMNECIPSAFTPNGDGLNDVFRPACITFQHLVDFRVYNRWGQEIFYSTNYKVGWDGTFNGIPQEIGTYFYMIILAKPGDRNMIYKGDVTLIR